MKLEIIFLFCTQVFLSFSQSASKASIVFTSGTEGYKTFRIPAIIKTNINELIAFCEGRVGGGADFGDIDIVFKKSKNGGKTWSKLYKLVDFQNLQAGNPAPVLDVSDPLYPQGRIFLFYNTGNNHENEMRKGLGIREVWYITSIDQGNTWSDPTNITASVHKPYQPHVKPEYSFYEDWRSYANTPGHALQIKDGNYKGRIFIPANHSEGNPLKSFAEYRSHAYYSDDHGKTFHLSQSMAWSGSNEATAVHLGDDRMMMNVRNQKGDFKNRIVALSNDGGTTWYQEYLESTLIDPVCEGSLIRFETDHRPLLLFSNAASVSKRDSLTISISDDWGTIWKSKILIDHSTDASQKDYTAYSDLVQLTKDRAGVLFERSNYKEIAFRSVKILLK